MFSSVYEVNRYVFKLISEESQCPKNHFFWCKYIFHHKLRDIIFGITLNRWRFGLITVKNDKLMYEIRLYIDYENIILKPYVKLKILRP